MKKSATLHACKKKKDLIYFEFHFVTFNIAVTLLQAFAWFSDLLVEHAEIFWSLFAVDMDAALEAQPPDTWDSFPLFQMLNDYLRTDGRTGQLNF